MEDIHKKLVEYLNAESKKGADRGSTILDLRRFFAAKDYSVCIVGEQDEVFASAIAAEKTPQLNWLSTNDKLDWLFEQTERYLRHDVDSLGCLDLFIRPHDVVIVQMNVAINHPYPERIISRFLNMARIKCFVLNSHKAFDASGGVHDAKPVIERVLEMNADKFKKTRDIQRSNGWTEFERKEPITNKRFDIL
jgi:hypothetical protein